MASFFIFTLFKQFYRTKTVDAKGFELGMYKLMASTLTI